MLQAAEQNLGLALTRELLAADALCDGRLVRLSSVAIKHAEAMPYHLVYPPGLRDWPPLASFRRWLHEEIERSLDALRAASEGGARARAPKRSTRPKRARQGKRRRGGA
jgi:LysR family glycine cleavage system transcriptional activator